jgi:hypothetical protein
MENILEKWNKYKTKGKSIVYELILFTKRFAIFQIFLSILVTTLDFAKPYFINRILVYILTRDENDNYIPGLILLLEMFIASIIRNVLKAHVDLSGRHWGIRIGS